MLKTIFVMLIVPSFKLQRSKFQLQGGVKAPLILTVSNSNGVNSNPICPLYLHLRQSRFQTPTE